MDEHENVAGLRITVIYGKNDHVSGIDLGLGVSRSNSFSGIQISGWGNATYLDESVPWVLLPYQPVRGYLDTERNVAKGVQIAGVYNEAANLSGVQVAIIANIVRDNATGVQVALANEMRGSITGVQAAWLNVVREHAAGIQIGIWNEVHGAMSGLQVGMFNNGGPIPFPLLFAGRGHFPGNRSQTGVQLGVVNFGGNVSGVQVGIFNESENLKGIQFGLLNHIENGLIPYMPFVNAKF